MMKNEGGSTKDSDEIVKTRAEIFIVFAHLFSRRAISLRTAIRRPVTADHFEVRTANIGRIHRI